jgi:chromosome segregation ATPase
MIDVLLPIVLFVGIATFAVVVVTLRSSRRSEVLGEGRYDLLRSQQEQLESMREERRMLIEELERESQERQQLMEILKGASPRLTEDLEQAQQRNIENERRAEQQEQERLRLEQELRRLEEELKQEGDERSRIQQQAEGAAHDLQQLRGDLEREREERQEAQRVAERLEQERLHLERELDRSKEVPGSGGPKARPWWRRPVPVAGLLLGALGVWLISLMVALNILSS